MIAASMQQQQQQQQHHSVSQLLDGRCAAQGEQWRLTKRFGRVRQGTIGREAGVYNFGAALNITQNWLGFNVRTRKVLNDFGWSPRWRLARSPWLLARPPTLLPACLPAYLHIAALAFCR